MPNGCYPTPAPGPLIEPLIETAEIDGLDIHLIHVKSPQESALPLIRPP